METKTATITKQHHISIRKLDATEKSPLGRANRPLFIQLYSGKV
jgi:hypothetical protein